MYYSKIKLTALYSILILTLASCAFGDKNFGQHIAAKSELMTNYSKKWDKGNKLAKKGQKILQTGQNRVEKGRSEIKKGDLLIIEGNTLSEDSQKEYQENSSRSGQSNTPEKIKIESKSLDTISNKWLQGLSKIKKGNALISIGGKRIKKGQLEITKGRDMTLKGHELMKSSEQLLKEVQDTPIIAHP